jgi:hypothetical protein
MKLFLLLTGLERNDYHHTNNSRLGNRVGLTEKVIHQLQLKGSEFRTVEREVLTVAPVAKHMTDFVAHDEL